MPVLPGPSDANEYIEQQLDKQISDIEDQFKANAISLSGPLIKGVDTIVRNQLEKRTSERPEIKRLVCILTTDGGYVEIVRRIVEVFRKDYEHVDFIIPDHAYSAGTILVMSGDRIWMDYYSRLGPIDPQVEGRSGNSVPALGYLERYNQLIKKAQRGRITLAEIQLLIQGFDQAELYQYEQARELSITLLQEWLVKYKFKNWTRTQHNKRRVTVNMRKDRAKQIAKVLSDSRKWHSHGHGISREVLERDLNLIVDDFGADPSLDEKIRCYYNLLDDYMKKLRRPGSAHTYGHYQPFFLSSV